MKAQWKILCVDDEPDLLRINSEILRSSGYEVLEASTGQECLNIAKKEHPDLILLDVMLPDMNGFDVCKQIKTDSNLADIYLILISGIEISSDSQIQGLEFGADGYIARPISSKELLARVQAMIRIIQSEKSLKEALQIAEHANKVKSDFLANISHELITPLNSIIGFSQILVDELYGKLNEIQKDYVNDILKSGMHLHSMLAAIIEIVKTESDSKKAELNEFYLKDLLKTSISLFEESAIMNNITLTLDIQHSPDLIIKADSGKLRQVLFQLLSNAVKFTQSGRSVLVKARKLNISELKMPDEEKRYSSERKRIYSELLSKYSEHNIDFIEVSVTDTGIGIKEEDMAKLFQMFTQLESPYAKKYSGTGIGLILAKRFIELHGGKIWAESEYGKGTTLTFIIPIEQIENK